MAATSRAHAFGIEIQIANKSTLLAVETAQAYQFDLKASIVSLLAQMF